MPLGTGVGLGPGDIVLDGAPAAPPSKKGGTAPNFRPMSIVVKRSPISATAELLFISFFSICIVFLFPAAVPCKSFLMSRDGVCNVGVLCIEERLFRSKLSPGQANRHIQTRHFVKICGLA